MEIIRAQKVVPIMTPLIKGNPKFMAFNHLAASKCKKGRHQRKTGVS
jgi:hypothetical protein